MGTFGNLRPCNFASEALIEISPLKESVCRGVDFTIIRELTGGIYFGDRKAEVNGDGVAWDKELYSRAEIERAARLAGSLATRTDPPLPVWSLDKANVLEAAGRFWRTVVEEVMKREFPTVKLGHQLIDSAAMMMVKNPRDLNGIIVTSNLFGDIISDLASAIPGSLGLLPSASLTGIPDGKNRLNGIYEPIHGMFSPYFLNPIQISKRSEYKDGTLTPPTDSLPPSTPPTSFPLLLYSSLSKPTNPPSSRFRPRHIRPRHREPRRHHSLCRNAVSILPQPNRRSPSRRRSCTAHYRPRDPHTRYRRSGQHGGGGRCGCEGVGRDFERMIWMGWD